MGAGALLSTGRWLAAAALLWVGGCGEAEPRAGEPLVVSAASSLRDALTELSAAFEVEHPGVEVAHNFGGSGSLKQQIRQGAGVDVFVAAAERDLDELMAQGRVDASTLRIVAGNELVLVARPAARGIRGFEDLAGPAVERVSLGAPGSVPAGEYARQVLERLGLWERVAPRAVLAANVRQVLAYVERGEVDAGLVYRTDALASTDVRVVATAPPDSHAPIRYPAAAVADSRHPELARRYLDFLAGPAAQEVLRRHGFSPAAAP